MIKAETRFNDVLGIAILVAASVAVGLLLGRPSGLERVGPLAGVVLFLLLVWDIRLVVPILAISLPFGPKFALSFGNLYLSTAILMIAYLAWLVRIPARGVGLTFKSNDIVLGVLALMGAFIISSLQSYQYLLSHVPAFLKFIQFLLYTGIFVMVYQMEFSRSQIKYLFVLMILVGVAQGIVGAEQWIRQPGFFVVGTFDNQHNLYASYATFMLVLLVGIILEAKHVRVFIAGLISAGILLYSIVFSFSRTGYISLLVSFILFAFLPIGRVKRTIVPVVAGVLTSAVLILVPVSVTERMRDIVTTAAGTYVTLSFKHRVILWKDAYEDFKGAPLFGQGAWAYGMGDNFFVKSGAEAGVVGLASFLLLLYFILRASWRLTHSRPSDSFMRGIAVGFFPAAVGGLIVFNLAGDSMSIHRFMGVFWIALALLLQYFSAERRGADGA